MHENNDTYPEDLLTEKRHAQTPTWSKSLPCSPAALFLGVVFSASSLHRSKRFERSCSPTSWSRVGLQGAERSTGQRSSEASNTLSVQTGHMIIVQFVCLYIFWDWTLLQLLCTQGTSSYWSSQGMCLESFRLSVTWYVSASLSSKQENVTTSSTFVVVWEIR